MKVNRFTFLAPMGLTLSALLIGVGCGGSSSSTPVATTTTSPNDAALAFDASKFTTVNVKVDGTAMAVRQYRVVYCAKPIKMQLAQSSMQGSITLKDPYAYQTMIISVPPASVNDQKAPIYFRVNNGGWFASHVDSNQFLVTDGATFTSNVASGASGVGDNSAVGTALKNGYIVVDVGSRGRGGSASRGWHLARQVACLRRRRQGGDPLSEA